MTAAKRIILNDDGWILSAITTPLDAKTIKERMIDTYTDSNLHTLSWCVGDSSQSSYESDEVLAEIKEISPRWLNQNRKMVNIKRLVDEGDGPLTTITRLGHQAGLRVLPSLRMNSHYDPSLNSRGVAPIRRDHPEYLIGYPETEFITNTLHWGVRTGLNYARPEVRKHVASLIIDLFESFDTDGVELDFMRHPPFFKIEEAYSSRHLMTDMMRYVRQRMNEVKAASNRDLELLVRVPPAFADSERIGLDVETWIRESIVDTVAVGGGFIPLHSSIREFVETAKGTDVQILGSLESLRLAVDDESNYANAARAYAEGASGLYMFNYWHKSADWKRRVLNTLADSKSLASTKKRYQLEFNERLAPNDLHSYSFRHAIPWVQLPVLLGDSLTNKGAVIKLALADEGEEETRFTLKLSFENLTPEDEIEVVINAIPLPSVDQQRTFGKWQRDEWTEFPKRVATSEYEGGVIQYSLNQPPLKQGTNLIELITIARTVMQNKSLILRDVELAVEH